MQTTLITLVIILLCLNIALVIFLIRNKKSENKEFEIQKILNELKENFSTQVTGITSSFNSLSKDVTRDTTQTLTKVDSQVSNLNQQIELLNKGQKDFTKILSGVKKYGVLAEYTLEAIIKDLLPANQYIANAKMRPEEDNTKVEFAVKLQNNVLCPIDSHWPVEKLKAVEDAYQSNDKKNLAESRKKLVSAIKKKAEDVMNLYIAPPRTTDFGILYLPTEGLYSELTSYQDPVTKILLIEELRQKYKVTLAGPNVLCAMIQAFHLGFQTLKIQKHAKQIYVDLTKISQRFDKHFMGVAQIRSSIQDALDEVENFGRDARSIKNTLQNIKDPDNLKDSISNDSEKVKAIK